MFCRPTSEFSHRRQFPKNLRGSRGGEPNAERLTQVPLGREVIACEVSVSQHSTLNYELSVENLAPAECEDARETRRLRSARHFAKYVVSRNARHSQ